MKKYRCPNIACQWVGYWPNVITHEKRNGDILVLTPTAYCPDCDKKLSKKDQFD